jgi:hypothetical protein
MSIFTHVEKTHVKSNTFDLSHDKKFTMKMGELTPIFSQEVLPGDKWNVKTTQLLRLAPMIAPIMHQITCYTHYFYVPNRILWDGWQDFITGGADGEREPQHPFIQFGQNVNGLQGVGSLSDYLGLPVANTVTGQYDVNALPFAAYQKIYDDYYRDQNLITSTWEKLTDGNNSLSYNKWLKIRKRAWQHDYFTSALPWTQRGPEATIPLGQTAPIMFNPTGTEDNVTKVIGGAIANGYNNFKTNSSGQLQAELVGTSAKINIDNSANLVTDLSGATASSIIDLRRAFKLQEFLEKNARGGARYNESILAHFGVTTSDGRLQRPEYLGGGATPITISEVLQTSDSAQDLTPQGNMAGHGISLGQNSKVNYRAEEHGWIIGIMSIMPKTQYSQGIPRQLRKFTKFDYYFPSFAHIGEQPIYNEELYAVDTADDFTIFGYTPRYAEYKYVPSTIHGEMRTTLNFWHLGREFSSKPNLNQNFVECNPDADRVFAVSGEEHFYVHQHYKVKANRKMPYFGKPRL